MNEPSRKHTGKHRPRMRTSPRPSSRPPRPAAAVPPTPGGADARSVAFETLIAIEERPVFVRVVLDDLCQAMGVSSRDRALAMEIAAGVTRRRATLDAVLAPHIRTPEGRIEPRLRTVLRMGVYQLLFLAVPPHAAVFEMVELARRRQPRWTRFVNGVLRSVQRDLTDVTSTSPGAHGVPICTLPNRASEMQVAYRQLNSTPFPAPEAGLPQYVAAAFSLPGWLVDRWAARYSADELLQLAAWFATPGRVSLRVNPLRSSTADVLKRLEESGVAALAGADEGALQLLESARVESLSGFAEGLFSVQDESAIAATVLLDPQPGQRVLDLCAAPGGKSAAMAERMQNCGQIVAADSDAARLALIAPGAARLGLSIIEPVVVRPDGSDIPAGPFDRILLDAPCSNTGVLGKRPEARWRISESGIAELAAIQSSLLRSAVERLAPGGRLVYSTCSIEPIENEQVVSSMLAERPELQLLSERQHLPGQPGDGGYQALMGNGR